MGKKSRLKQERKHRELEDQTKQHPVGESWFKMSGPRLTQLLTFVALVALCVVVIFIKVWRTTKQHPYYDAISGENFYWSESAFHFRHAEMIAQGKAIPAKDTMIQYPEGLDTRRYITPVMEHVYGRLHRWLFADMPLHHFLTYATAILSTLSVVACFSAGKALGASAWVGLFCASLYGLALGSLARNYGAFIREDFALPLLFGSFACFVSCMRKERWVIAAVGAVLLVIGLASWHVSQFYFFLLVVGLALLATLYPVVCLPRQTFTIYTVATLATAIVLPALRAKYYAASIPMMISYALLIVLWLFPHTEGWSRRRIVVINIAFLTAFAGAGALVQRATGTQSHVFAVLWAKLTHLGALPTDPTLLSFEARTMWSSAFLSPSANEFFMLLTTSLLFAAIAMILLLPRICRRQVTAAQTLLVYWSAATFTLFLMFRRMVVFAIFFLALLAGMAWLGRIRWQKIALIGLFVPCIIFELGKHSWLQVFPRTPPKADIADITRFLRMESKPGEAVLTTLELGAPIAAYANRPVLIHSKFESKTLREKVERIYMAFFEDENTLYGLCQEYQARYLVYENDMALRFGAGSMLYFAGHDVLPRDSAVFLCHFAPDKLHYFHLVHQNGKYRVFRIGLYPDDASSPLPHNPLFDLGLFTDDDTGKILTNEEIKTGLAKLDSMQALIVRADQLLKARRAAECAEVLREALHIYPRHPYALFVLAEALINTGEYQSGAKMLSKAVKLDPRLEPDYRRRWPPAALITFAIAKNEQGDFVTAEQICRRALGHQSDSWEAQLYLGLSLSNQNRLTEAETALNDAVRLNPRCFEAHEQLGRIYASRQEYQRACDSIAHALAIAPKQTHLRDTLAELRALAERFRKATR